MAANSTCHDGGRFSTGSLFAPGEYAARSDQAHLVMSLTLCASTAGYALFFLGVQGWPVSPQAIRRAACGFWAYSTQIACTQFLGLL